MPAVVVAVPALPALLALPPSVDPLVEPAVLAVPAAAPPDDEPPEPPPGTADAPSEEEQAQLMTHNAQTVEMRDEFFMGTARLTKATPSHGSGRL